MVIAGVSVSWPAPRSTIRRSSWAWAQVSGEAEPAACPSAKPIDAVVGSDPYGEAARSGSSHTCSGTRPSPEAELIMKESIAEASDESPSAIADSPRSPDSTGHRCPVPISVVGHGSPTVVQEVWLG